MTKRNRGPTVISVRKGTYNTYHKKFKTETSVDHLKIIFFKFKNYSNFKKKLL